MRKYIFMILTAAVFAACEPTLVAEFTDRPVVSCYLQAGKTPTLTVQKLIPFQDDALFSDEDIDKLVIEITDITTGNSYSLAAQSNGQYTNESLIIESGHEYELHFNYNGEDVTAKTIVPSAPQGV